MMDIVSTLLLGLNVAIANSPYCALGVLLGVAAGTLPGIGAPVMIALLLPFTYALAPAASLVLLLGVYVGALYGSATLGHLVDSPSDLRIEGHASPDARQLVRMGFGGRVLAAVGIASFFGAAIGTAVAALGAPTLAHLASTFGNAEYFAAIVLTFAATLAVGRGPLPRALGTLMLGLLLGLVGVHLDSGTARLTFGVPELSDGIGFAVVAIGTFALGEIIAYSADPNRRDVVATKLAAPLPTPEDLRRIVGPLARGALGGSLAGMVPGGGPSLAASVAYDVEGRLSSKRDQLGRGAIEGVAAPAASSASGAVTSLIPLLTLGIPSSAAMVMIMAAMIIHGVLPGPLLIAKQPAIFWAMIVSVWVGTLLVLAIVLPTAGAWLKLFSLPYTWMYPAVVGFCALAIVGINNSGFDVFVAALFGVLGYAFKRLDVETLPFLLGFMLAPLLEENLGRAVTSGRGELSTFIDRPVSAVLLLLAFVILVTTALKQFRSRDQAAA